MGTADGSSVIDETGAGARTAGAGAGTQAAQAGSGVDIGMDIGQTEGFTSQNLKEARLTFSNDKLALDQQLSEQRQREIERQAINAETISHSKNVNALELQGLADNQRLARETAADSRRHADSGFQTRLETISDNSLLGTSEVLKAIGEAIVALAAQITERNDAPKP